jgi:hypothetical protein
VKVDEWNITDAELIRACHANGWTVRKDDGVGRIGWSLYADGNKCYIYADTWQGCVIAALQAKMRAERDASPYQTWYDGAH